MKWLLIFAVIEVGSPIPVNDRDNPLGEFPTHDRCWAAGTALSAVAGMATNPVERHFACLPAGVPT